MKRDELMLFALNTSRGFGESVSQLLGVPLSPHEEREFEDGEHKARPLTSVRGCDVFVIQSLYGDLHQSVNDKLCRLLFFLGALKDASASRVVAVVPYLAYARKDRKSQARDPVTTRYVATLFEAVGTDCVVTMDVHNLSAYQNAFRCRTENLEACGIFAAHFASSLKDAEIAVVSPDAGGIKRADQFRRRLGDILGRPIAAAFAEKYRAGGEVSGEALIGEVGGKVAIILDDLISAGNTVARTARACLSRGATRVYAAATHGVFAGEANAVLGPSEVERIVVTDTILPVRVTDEKLKAKLTQVSAAGAFAEAIRRIHGDGPLGQR